MKTRKEPGFENEEKKKCEYNLPVPGNKMEAHTASHKRKKGEQLVID